MMMKNCFIIMILKMKHQHLVNFDVNVKENNGQVVIHMRIIIRNVKAVIKQFILFLLKQKKLIKKMKMIKILMILADVKNAKNQESHVDIKIIDILYLNYKSQSAMLIPTINNKLTLQIIFYLLNYLIMILLI